MFRFWRPTQPNGLLTSQLFDQSTFYRAFVGDLRNCKSEVIIESPFITSQRIDKLLPTLKLLKMRGVKIVVNTRHPHEHEGYLQAEAEIGVDRLHAIGVEVFATGGHHRKLAIIDRTTLWEGSLNILSHYDSCEIMRKITSKVLAEQMINFLGLKGHLLKENEIDGL